MSQKLELKRSAIKWAINGQETSEQNAMAALVAGQET